MFSDILAHDINNLLMIVTGCCDRLAAGSNLTPDQRADLERISLATNHAGWLTGQLMAANRQQPADSQVTELGAALGMATRLLEHALGDRITIDLQLAPHAMWVPMNDGEVTQILVNLGLNARDAMPDGGVLGVSTTAIALDERAGETLRLPAGTYVSLEVRDSGSGMSAETRAQAFDRFFTTKPNGRGAGLGLASVKRVIQRSGGTVDIRSVPGVGTRFTILLPVVDAPAQEAMEASAHAALRARPGERVLVAEDEPVVRDIVGSLLRDLGYDIVEVSTAEAALSTAHDERVDLVLVDVDLPDMNGRDLAARLKERSPATPVVFMSGFADEPESRGNDVFLQKPFTRVALGRKVREVLDQAGS
jgi:CheY-like chemotaxis protein